MEEKKQLGQFFTKNSSYILQNFEEYVFNKNVADPFAGDGDLLLWAENNKAQSIIGFDIDKRYFDHKIVFGNDSILNKNKYDFVITNPPFLNINKASSDTKKKYFRHFDLEDLYQISLSSILDSNEGIIIVPINFLSADNSKKIREMFFTKFEIVELNYFTEQVFSDTTYNVISFYYRKRKNLFEDKMNIKAHIYPENKNIVVTLQRKFGWSIGGELISEIKHYANRLRVRRLQEKDLHVHLNDTISVKLAYNHTDNIVEMKIPSEIYKRVKENIILLKAIDSGSEEGKIALEDIRRYGVNCLVSKESARHMVQLIFDKNISIDEQKSLIGLFNKEISNLRQKYFSLFLTNYRDNDRKRISFDFVYKFINFLYFNNINKTDTDKLLFR